MIDLQLKVENNEVVIKKYNVSYPYSLQALQRTTSKIIWYVSSIECKNIQGSFRLFYAKIFPMHNDDKITSSGPTTTTRQIHGGTLTYLTEKSRSKDPASLDPANPNWIAWDKEEYVALERKNLIHVDENDKSSFLNDRKTTLAKYLIVDKLKTLQESIHFWLEYEDVNLTLDNEEITLVLRLEYE